MAITQTENRVLHELAYIYIALAHGADADLSDEEIDQIATRLKVWEIETAQTVTSALKQAMDEYIAESSLERLDQAVRTVRVAFPDDKRAALMRDLMEIALADGRFLFQEGSFIERVARLLEVHQEEGSGMPGKSWSILGGTADESGSWSPVHDLALIYVTLAHRPDDDLSSEEILAIATKLNEWVPDAQEDDVLRVVQDALSVYVQGPDKRMFTEAVESIRSTVPKHQLAALLEDLTYVADADGRRLSEEEKMIDQLTRAWSGE